MEKKDNKNTDDKWRTTEGAIKPVKLNQIKLVNKPKAKK